jgi:hypothetical protein
MHDAKAPSPSGERWYGKNAKYLAILKASGAICSGGDLISLAKRWLQQVLCKSAQLGKVSQGRIDRLLMDFRRDGGAVEGTALKKRIRATVAGFQSLISLNDHRL